MTKKAVSFKEFEALTYADQIDTLHRYAVYIGKRKVEGQTLILLQLNSFYVEVVYLKYRRAIASMRFSSSTDILTPYLPQIDIGNITKHITEE